MRHLMITTILAALPLGAMAEDAALVLGVERYERLGRLSRGDDVVVAAQGLETLGFDVTSLANGRADTTLAALNDFVAEAEDENEAQQQPAETWHYAGVDVQYFAALLFPSTEQVQQSLEQNLSASPRGYLAHAQPQLVYRDSKSTLYVHASVVLTSHDIELDPGESLTHKYILYTGPKRPQLLTPLRAQDVLDITNILWIGKHISRAMLYFLGVIHSLVPGLGYGFAIIVLTISVRLGMHPLTRKQALSAKIMKDLKPEIDLLKEKHGTDKQAFGRAQMDLFRKHNYNPFSGCLPIIVQLPIFIGLYQALGSSVDLRRASFLYIDNLAGPDRLFPLGFTIPYLGSDFNLLPLVTVGLYLINNKMFMPPHIPPVRDGFPPNPCAGHRDGRRRRIRSPPSSIAGIR
ncbi:MAG: hypothetical protein COB65_09820 [Thalassobium sp.]|nr:MAG: hypothetical protein COB65_09820 [Thalassobium sp.]